MLSFCLSTPVMNWRMVVSPTVLLNLQLALIYLLRVSTAYGKPLLNTVVKFNASSLQEWSASRNIREAPLHTKFGNLSS